MGECGIIDLDFIIPIQPETILNLNVELLINLDKRAENNVIQ